VEIDIDQLRPVMPKKKTVHKREILFALAEVKIASPRSRSTARRYVQESAGSADSTVIRGIEPKT